MEIISGIVEQIPFIDEVLVESPKVSLAPVESSNDVLLRYMVPSRHYPITDTGDAHLRRPEIKEDNGNAVSSVFQLMNYPPKPASRKGYFDDKIRLLLNEALDSLQKQASGAKSDAVKFVRRGYQRPRDGVGANVLGARNRQIFGHEGRLAGTIRPSDYYGVFRQWLPTVQLAVQIITFKHEMVGRRLAIVLVIHSLDGFLSHGDLYRIGISIARANRVLDLFAHLIYPFA